MTRVCVLDDVFPPGLVAAAAAAWPGDEAPWVCYATPDQRKRTLGCRRHGDLVRSDWPDIPPPCRDLLARLLALDVGNWLGLPGVLVPDSLLWGAGLHEMRAGDFLARHLDADRHFLTGMERRANAILFLGAWEPAWGGALEIAGAPPVVPAPGRVVAFETTDDSWHGVTPLACPPEARRLSLACYWFGEARGAGKRPRAQFVQP